MRSAATWFTALALVAGAAAGCGHKSSVPTAPVLGAPILTSINGATQPSGPIGSTAILEGGPFGASQGSGRVLFSDGAGGVVTATIAQSSDWSDGFIVTAVPAGAATGPVWIQTSGGVSDSITFAITQSAAFNPSAISWTGTTPLPIGVSGHAAVFVPLSAAADSGVVYVLGGADSSEVPRSDVLYAPVQADGSLGSWTPASGLPGGLAFEAAVAATPFNSRVGGTSWLYVLGGATDATGAPAATVYRARLNSDGSIGSWSSAGNLPTAVHSAGAVIFHGDLYVAGGATDGNTPVAAVYRSRIDSTGALGSWQPQSSLPSGRSYHALISFGGYLYALGGDASAVAPNDSANTGTMMSNVAYARINLRTGDLVAGWTSNPTGLSKAVSKHTAVVSGGYVLVTAGIYNGDRTGSTEETYAQLNADGTVSSFNGATGSHTILSAGGKDLFNHAAVSYRDGSGVAHVMVLGGDDLNAPGKKRAEVWFY